MRSRKILVVEDDPLIGLDLCDMVADGGYVPEGPLATVAAALERIADTEVDAALLDVRLGNELVTPIADALARNRVPFVFLTGYAKRDVPTPYGDRPVIEKPCTPAQLIAKIGAVLGCAQASGA
jgi:DNA-binding response OmpR family regulator